MISSRAGEPSRTSRIIISITRHILAPRAACTLNTVNPAGDICGTGTSRSILGAEPGIGILQYLFIQH